MIFICINTGAQWASANAAAMPTTFSDNLKVWNNENAVFCT